VWRSPRASSSHPIDSALQCVGQGCYERHPPARRYTARNQKPFTEATAPGHEDRSAAIVETTATPSEPQQRAARYQAEVRIEMLLYLAQWRFARAGARVRTVILPFSPA